MRRRRKSMDSIGECLKEVGTPPNLEMWTTNKWQTIGKKTVPTLLLNYVFYRRRVFLAQCIFVPYFLAGRLTHWPTTLHNKRPIDRPQENWKKNISGPLATDRRTSTYVHIWNRAENKTRKEERKPDNSSESLMNSWFRSSFGFCLSVCLSLHVLSVLIYTWWCSRRKKVRWKINDTSDLKQGKTNGRG